MDGSQTPGSGFSPHVLDRLNEAAMQVSNSKPGSDQGQTRQPWNNSRPGSQPSIQFGPNAGPYRNAPPHQPPHPQPWGYQPPMNPNDQTAFPPLHAAHPREAGQNPLQRQQHQQLPPPGPPQRQAFVQPQQPRAYNSVPPPHSLQGTHNAQRGFNARGRGRPFRGRGNPTFNHSQQQGQGHWSHSGQPQATDSFNRPAPITRKLFTPGGQPQFNSVEDQRAFQRMIMNQSDFLNHLASQSLKNQLTTEEQQAKECFRKELEAIAKRVVSEAKTDDMQFNLEHVQLALYGSLGSGFALSGSDMDLLLAFPQGEGSLANIEMESRRRLEKALLDAGIGARLLENTRVPILRVCQKPSQELLQNLRDHRLNWEQGLTKEDIPVVDEGWGPLPLLTDLQTVAATQALADLSLDAHKIPLPASPVPEAARLEYVGDCGIQCDINFSNYVALHNTRLLKTYGLCDPRVRQVGVFVKNWAKARDINTTYHGTLSSYGYILMVLHYLMNIVSPPIIPNLQVLATQNDAWDIKTEVELVEGHDVRFIRDMNQVHAILKDMPRNHESVGALLRGFFWYYADPQGFHWMHDVVSIRTRGGRLTKRSKDWTEAKRSGENQNVRLRYLLAIEDPFELDHNVARTVGHHGIVAIREEFRRAWEIIENVQYDSDAKMWFWLTKDARRISGLEMIAAAAEKKGDLHRKDQEYARRKVRQMRLNLEAKERALQESAARGSENSEETPNGTSKVKSYSSAQERRPSVDSSAISLIYGDVAQINEHHQTPWEENATWQSEIEHKQEELGPQHHEIDWDKPFDETEGVINPEFVSDVTNEGVEEHTFQNVETATGRDGLATDKSICNDSQPFNPTSEELPFVKIAWTRESKSGRWLCWRDRQISKGTWTGAKTRIHKRLDEAFPYDPNMTVADLAAKNKILCLNYEHTLVPRVQLEKTKQAVNDSHVSAKTSTGTGTNTEEQNIQPPVAKSGRRRRSLPSKSWKDVSNGATATSVASVSTCGRDRTNNNAIDKRKGSTVTSDEPTRTQHVSRSSQLPVSSELTAGMRSNDTPNEWGTANSSKQPHSMSSSEPAGTQQDQGTESQHQPSWEEQSVNDVVHRDFVPPASNSDVRSSQQLKEKDSNTMLVQRSLSFKFDPRQLADLEVIRRGGNGCAREDKESQA